jgi:integrase
MFTRTRFQQGSLTKEERQRGADVWVYRWREAAPEGGTKRKKMIIGTVQQYPTESLARRQLATLGLDINDKQSEGAHPALMTMAQLIDHYQETELGVNRYSKAQSTVDVYNDYIRCRIKPRWKDTRLGAFKPVEVESWLRSLDLADGTKAKIRNIMGALFQHGLRHQFVSVNPIRGLVRQSAKRQREPDVLTAKEICSILGHLSPLTRTMVFLAASTGLRFSELRGLQWQDVDFDSGTLQLKRGVVNNHLSELKTAASRKPVPLHPGVLVALRVFRSTSAYREPSDWVFASSKAKGRVSVWPSSLMADHVLPAVKAAGVLKHVTWHVFRHSYATLLKANHEDVKVVQESLRHANPGITMGTYVQAVPEDVRSAHGLVVEQIMSGAANGPGMDPRWG